MSPLDTIAAISTPLGEGGLAVIRVSGARAIQLAQKTFSPAKPTDLSSVPSHTVHYGWIRQQSKTIDEVLLSIFHPPRTFTGEPTIEVSCHGGILPAKLVLDTFLQAGARLAEPGEFTRRAFLNGRIDLAQAEAVIDLIHSRTELALRAANEQLAGHLSQKINRLRDDLMLVLAHVEAHIDFPDEDIAPDTRDQLIAKLQAAREFIDRLIATAPEGQILRRGIRVAIVGKPNVGKSSLLNQLLGRDRAIVSPTPGTTRDTIEETANIRGIPVIFIDTAGLRESSDAIEQEGIRRSRASLEKADLILHILDRSDPSRDHSSLPPEKTIVVLNKADLPAKLEFYNPAVAISCQTGAGLESLKDAIKNRVWKGNVGSEMNEVMINARHEDALRRALSSLNHTNTALTSGASLELVAMDLRIAVNAIGEIVGKTTTDDLLDAIFSQFCLGK